MGCGCSDSGMPCKCSKHGVLSPITTDSFPGKQRSKSRNVKKGGGSPQLLPIGAPPGGGHVIGHVVWLGPQPQLVEPFILDVGGGQHLAGGIFRIGGGQQVGGGIFNLANVASPIDLRAEVAPPISVAPSRCDCKKATCYDGSEDSCAHPKGCCPTVVTITPKLEQPEMSPNQDTPCFFGPTFQLDATLHLACDCTKDDGTKAKCPKVRFGVIQVCQFRHKIEYADFTRCDQFGIRIVHSIDA